MQHLVLGHTASHAVYLLLDGIHGFIHNLNLLFITSLLPSQLLQLQSNSIRFLTMHKHKN